MDNFKFRIKSIILTRCSASNKVFAERLGIASSTIQVWDDNHLPKGDILQRIQNKFNVDINWLLTGKGEPYLTPATPYPEPEAHENSLEGRFTDEPKGLYGTDRVTQEEYDMVAAIRELDALTRQGIYLTVMNELNTALREKKVKSEERKKRILEKALKTLNKAVGEYA